MDRATAEATMSLLMQLNTHISEMTVLISKLSDTDQQKQLRRPLGDLIVEVNHNMMRPIVRTFPDLDPDR